MLNTATVTSTPSERPIMSGLGRPAPVRKQPSAIDAATYEIAHRQISDNLQVLQTELAPQRRIVRAGGVIYQAGERFTHLYIVNSGVFKLTRLSPDGREQVVGLKLRGDWLGFDGIANGQFGCDAVAMDVGEVWLVRYDELLASFAQRPVLASLLHEAMSREITRERDSLMSVCTLSADARVADFLRYWADALARRGMRIDQITLRLTRAEIGNYLGMTLETVSRALSKLARHQLINFTDKGRRDIGIPDLSALTSFVYNCVAPEAAAVTLQ